MIKLTLNKMVQSRLLSYAEKDLRQGHWGNAEIVIPEQQYLYEMIRRSGSTIELSLLQMETLCRWIMGALKGGRILTLEEIKAIKHVRIPLERYKKSLRGDNHPEMEDINIFLKRFSRICRGIEAMAAS